MKKQFSNYFTGQQNVELVANVAEVNKSKRRECKKINSMMKNVF
jgi:hypothetical protein